MKNLISPLKFFIPAFLGSLILLASCKREYDSPPERILPVGNVLTIEELRNLYQGEPVRFDTAFSVYAVVTADESSGNLYRNIHVQDQTGAIVLRLNTPGGIYEGDSVRIYLPGTILSPYQGMMQLDSVDVDNNIIKQATQVFVPPIEINSLSEITPDIQGYLVKVNNVEFAEYELGQTFADAVNQNTENRDLVDCNNNSVLVRTSGFANFANEPLPGGNGSMIAVISQFNDDMQLYIRRFSEVQLNGERCDGSSGGGECEYDIEPQLGVSQDFSSVTVDNSDFSDPLWLNINEQGDRFWRGREFSGDKYARATGFSGTGVSVPPTEIWLITPPVIATSSPAMNFRSAQAFWSHDADEPFRVYISNDFDGCDISAANWTEITNFNKPTSSNSNYQWVQSGDISLTQYLPQGYEGSYHIGFRYYSVDLQTTTIDLDDINIQ